MQARNTHYWIKKLGGFVATGGSQRPSLSANLSTSQSKAKQTYSV